MGVEGGVTMMEEGELLAGPTGWECREATQRRFQPTPKKNVIMTVCLTLESCLRQQQEPGSWRVCPDSDFQL